VHILHLKVALEAPIHLPTMSIQIVWMIVHISSWIACWPELHYKRLDHLVSTPFHHFNRCWKGTTCIYIPQHSFRLLLEAATVSARARRGRAPGRISRARASRRPELHYKIRCYQNLYLKRYIKRLPTKLYSQIMLHTSIEVDIGNLLLGSQILRHMYMYEKYLHWKNIEVNIYMELNYIPRTIIWDDPQVC
jgi:hypothetical protein